MKKYPILTLLLCGAISIAASFTTRAAETSETELIGVLQSPSSTYMAKVNACMKLKLVGTPASVKALAALLTDAQLSHPARYALETIPGSAAEKALLQTLPKTSGLIQAGIVTSLGNRRDTAAVSSVGKLLQSTNEAVAMASAEALGRIGGSKSLSLLQGQLGRLSGSLHNAEVDGVLSCANQMLNAGDRKHALGAFEKLYATEKTATFRQAAFRGIILSTEKGLGARLNDALLKGDAPTWEAALQASADLPGAEVTKVLADALGQAPIPMQFAIIESLVQRGDTTAVPALKGMLQSPDAQIRSAAVTALGILGDASVIPILDSKAAGGAERKVAQEALVRLNHGAITPALLMWLKSSSPEIKVELIRALGARGDAAAIPALLELAQNGGDQERTPALQALGLLARGAEIPRMVQLVANARTAESRADAAEALNTVFQRLQSPGDKLDLGSFVNAVKTGGVETRLALLPLCSEVPQASVRDALHAAVADTDERVRDAAIHALCDSRDTELLPEMLKIACDTNQAGLRMVAIQGCVRVVSQDDATNLSNATKLDALNAIIATPLNTQGKRLVLSALGTIGDDKALAVALNFLDDAAVKAEAEQAVVHISDKIFDTRPTKSRDALRKVRDTTGNPDTKKLAEAVLKKIK